MGLNAVEVSMNDTHFGEKNWMLKKNCNSAAEIVIAKLVNFYDI